jgi:hypothetical protein
VTKLPTLLAVALALLLQSALWAGQPKKESAEAVEEKQAALEDEAEKLLTEKEQFLKQLNGKIVLNPFEPGEPVPKVVGTFYVENGAAYLLKVADPKLLKELLPNNNRRVMLAGKIRNEGKYFIANLVVQQLVAPVERRRRGGI